MVGTAQCAFAHPTHSTFKQCLPSSHAFAIPPPVSREVLPFVPLSEIRGRRECRTLDASAAARGVKNTRVSHHGHTEIIRHSPRNGFNGFLRALPGDRALLPPSPALLLADLTPASGRQDHTTSPSASAPFVKGTVCVHRIPFRVDDVGQRPSVVRDMRTHAPDLPDVLSGIFFAE